MILKSKQQPKIWFLEYPHNVPTMKDQTITTEDVQIPSRHPGTVQSKMDWLQRETNWQSFYNPLQRHQKQAWTSSCTHHDKGNLKISLEIDCHIAKNSRRTFHWTTSKTFCSSLLCPHECRRRWDQRRIQPHSTGSGQQHSRTWHHVCSRQLIQHCWQQRVPLPTGTW